MNTIFVNKVIYIFSPQPWNYLQLSKHHYARTLAKQNQVYFIEPPTDSTWFSLSSEQIKKNLTVIRYSLPTPGFLRFKFPGVYKAILRFYLSQNIRKHIPVADVVFDFGCYQQFDTLDFVSAHYKIFFPVDDIVAVQPNDRDANLVLTVSKNIQVKFPEGKCHFINHGLAEEFSSLALQFNRPWQASDRIRVGCAGNLFIRYIDTSTIIQLVNQNPEIEFHFFGSCKPNLTIGWEREWFEFLKGTSNIRLHGILSTADLASAYDNMDIFLLCYNPDYVYYHGENSHKILEYLSTGKTIVSSWLSIYEGTNLIEMTPRDDNRSLVSIFKKVVSSPTQYNSSMNIELRKQYALENTYEKNIQRISDLLKSQNNNCYE